MTITNSTISGNIANGSGGGSYLTGGNMTIANSTISDNTAKGRIYGALEGGAIGSRLNNDPGNSLKIINSIIAGNTLGNARNNCSLFLFAPVTDMGNSLSDDSTCNLTGMGSSQNFNTAMFLGSLSDNGGSTQTHALLNPDPGNNPNPAIDAVTAEDCTLAEDQRGFSRPSGDSCDTGAFEFQQEPFIKITKLTDPVIPGSDFSFTLFEGSTIATAFDLSHGEIFSSVLDAGSYRLEEARTGGSVKGVECSDNSVEPGIMINNKNSSLPLLGVDFTVAVAQHLDCTVTNTRLVIVNEHLAGVINRDTITTNIGPEAGFCAGSPGEFLFTAIFTNISETADLSELAVQVNTLTNGNTLGNADKPGGAGAILTVEESGGYSDGVLGPDETVNMDFVICLDRISHFAFFVDVLGTINSD